MTRIADPNGPVDSFQARQKRIVHVLVHDQAPQAGASLSGRAHRSKRDGSERQIQIRRGANDPRVVPAELENGTRKTSRQPGCDGAAHRCRAGGRDGRHARIAGQKLARLTTADQQRQKPLRAVPELSHGLLKDGPHRQRA